MFLNLAFVHDEITDLDEFSHPRSPQVNLLAGSPRHEFCYSETDISAAITPNVNNPGVDTTMRKSRSHESLSDLRTANTLQLEKKHNYINLAYDRDSGDTEQLDDTGRNCNSDANLNDEDTGYSEQPLYGQFPKTIVCIHIFHSVLAQF
ncbi:hypothetical protein FSP39_012549 [Pinctada imbricata]|uniref:Uncharacterized protein n=1 Tax=Pinctada imbricata TaxID=66713 RepID=A0AA89C1B4_PINIB|nr:hypothetical protein FSP39_012549 [Pinctada imbricata]